jgi:hypothetical protein
MVSPTGKTLPEGTPLRATVTPAQLSLALAVPSVPSRSPTVTPHDVAPAPVYNTLSAGAVIVGGVLSMTVMVCVELALLPAASVAVKTREMISGLAAEPAPLLVSLTVTVGVPQLSDGGPGGRGLPFASVRGTPLFACDGSAAGTSLGQV